MERVAAEHLHRNGWYRAQQSEERISLDLMHQRGLLQRRLVSGVEGEQSAVYEYRLSEEATP